MGISLHADPIPSEPLGYPKRDFAEFSEANLGLESSKSDTRREMNIKELQAAPFPLELSLPSIGQEYQRMITAQPAHSQQEGALQCPLGHSRYHLPEAQTPLHWLEKKLSRTLSFYIWIVLAPFQEETGKVSSGNGSFLSTVKELQTHSVKLNFKQISSQSPSASWIEHKCQLSFKRPRSQIRSRTSTSLTGEGGTPAGAAGS